jgi:anti-sigma B factor antagonist
VQPNFHVDVRHDQRAPVITVSGELDLASSPELEAELARVECTAPELVVVDLSGLEFMDSTGLAVVVNAHRRAKRDGRRFAIVRGAEPVQRLMSLTGVDRTITLADTLHELLDER